MLLCVVECRSREEIAIPASAERLGDFGVINDHPAAIDPVLQQRFRPVHRDLELFSRGVVRDVWHLPSVPAPSASAPAPSQSRKMSRCPIPNPSLVPCAKN